MPVAVNPLVTVGAGAQLNAGSDFDQVGVAGNGVGQINVTAGSPTSTSVAWRSDAMQVFDFSNLPTSFGDSVNKGTDWNYFSVTGKLAITATNLAPMTLNIDF